MSATSLARRPSTRDFAAHTNGVVDGLEKLTKRLASGKLDLDGWADAFHAVLVDGHAGAYALGRQRSGDLSARGEEDDRFGLDAADGQGEYLQNFLEQMRAGDPRYFDEDGAVHDGPLNVRVRQYASRLRATASEAFVDASEPDDEFDWEYGGSEHCADCIDLHGLSPYTASTIISHPGDGQTECKVNCTCRLVRRRDKVAMFDRVDVYLA